MKRNHEIGAKSWPQRAGLLVLGLLCAVPATSQIPPTERVRERNSIATLIPHQQVIFDDGKYALVDNKTPADKYKEKEVQATCPQGMKAMSAGFAASSGAGEPREYRVINSTPTDNGAGWVVYARFDLSGNLLAADYDWALHIHLVCAKLS